MVLTVAALSLANSVRVRRVLPLTAVLVLILIPTLALAQGAKGKKGTAEPEKITGKIAEVEKKGKATTLSIEKADGGKLEILVTPKLKFSVMGKGDAAFLQPKAVVSSESIVTSNMELFGSRFTVHLGGGAPAAGVANDPNSADVFHVCGHVVSVDKDSVTINFGQTGTRKITFEQGTALDVTVQSTDAALATEGAAVEVEGATRGNKFLPSRVTVTLDKPLVADEVFASGDKKGAKPKPAVAKTAKKGVKADEPAGESAADPKDPFGVLDKKDVKRTKSTDGKKDNKKSTGNQN